MNRYYITSALVFVLFFYSATAQDSFQCAIGDNFSNPLQNQDPEEYMMSGQPEFTLGIFFHIIRQANGSGGQPISTIYTAHSILNSDFNDFGICFMLLGYDEILDDDLYFDLEIGEFTIGDPDIDGNGKLDLVEINTHENAIDIYLFADDQALRGGVALIPGTSIVIGGTFEGTEYDIAIAISNVLSHEMGHSLGLFHTFHGLCEGGCDELVDGSNCEDCGDFVCDTDADPSIFQTNQTTCEWSGTTCSNSVANTDANGDSYVPDKHNIMAYSPPNCMQYFTTGQEGRMLGMISFFDFFNFGGIENCIVPQNVTIDNETFSEDNIVVAAINNITANDIEVISGAELTLVSGNLITVNTLSSANSGSYFHAYIDNACSSQQRLGNPDDDKFANTNTDEDESENISADYFLRISPNPANTSVLIESYKTISSVVFYDLLGSKLLEEQNTQNNSFNVSSLSQGVYLLKVFFTDQTVETARIVIQR